MMNTKAPLAHPDPVRIRSVIFEPDDREINLTLSNGASVRFSISQLGVPFRQAPDTALAEIAVNADGTTLRWEALDVEMPLLTLLSKVFEVGSLAARSLGSRTSAAKAEAARRNGRRGGRPRKNPVPA